MPHHHTTRTAALAVALAALSAPGALAAQNLSSPDARDAALGRGTSTAPHVTVVRVPTAAPDSGGIDWEAAGLGAGGTLGVVLLATGGTLLLTHRPRRRAAP
jgi:hypothetical protein